jgi:hypothetical protein
MNINKFQQYLSLLIVLVFVSACSAPAVVSQVAGTPLTSTSTAASPLSPSIRLEPCRLGSTAAQCGTMKVYENRASRSGRTFDLRVAVIKAQSENPAPDPIFYLAGGPGDAATGDGARKQFPSPRFITPRD